MTRQLCQKYKLREAVIVNTDDDADGPILGKSLARACAGYFFRRLMVTVKEGKVTRLGIAHGWSTKQVLEELKEMQNSGLLQKPPTLSGKVIWSPLIGNITVEWREQEATVIANDFKEYFGGDIETFQF